MKILYTHYLGDDDHPAARMVHSVARELGNLGHDVRIHVSRCSASGGVIERSASARSNASNWVRGRMWFARMIARDRRQRLDDLIAIRAFGPDVVLARQDAYRSSVAWAAGRACVPLVTYADAPVAHELRTYGDGSRWHPPGLVEAIERSVLSRSRAVVTISRPSAEILGRYGLRVPITVAPNGVNPADFPKFDSAERSARRCALGITEEVVIGFQGTFKAFHGLDRLRDLILATAERRDVRWLLIGDGPGRTMLHESIVGRARATFLGRRDADEMGSLLALMDVAVAPHEIGRGPFYFCPLKILEYAAAGCAILASDQGDIASLLDEGRAAKLLREPETAAWLNALRQLLDDESERVSLQDSARLWVLANRTWSDTARLVHNVLCSSVGAQRPTARSEEALQPVMA